MTLDRVLVMAIAACAMAAAGLIGALLALYVQSGVTA